MRNKETATQKSLSVRASVLKYTRSLNTAGQRAEGVSDSVEQVGIMGWLGDVAVRGHAGFLHYLRLHLCNKLDLILCIVASGVVYSQETLPNLYKSGRRNSFLNDVFGLGC